MIRKLTIAAMATGTLIALGLVGNMDAADERRQHTQYCADVELWRSPAQANVPFEHRAGHPDHRDIYADIC